MRHRIQWEPRGTIVTFKGDINIDDIMNANYELNGDARYYMHVYSIWVFTGCDLSKIQPEDTIHPVAIDIGASRTILKFKVCIIVSDDYSHNIAQIYIDQCIAMEIPWQFKIVNNLDDATSWCST